MPEIGNLVVGGQLQTTPNIPGGVLGPPATVLGGSAAGPPINGSFWTEGPMLVGSPLTYPSPRPLATMMLGRSKNYLAPETSGLPILMVSSRASAPTPTDLLIGDPSGPVGPSTVISNEIVSPLFVRPYPAFSKIGVSDPDNPAVHKSVFSFHKSF